MCSVKHHMLFMIGEQDICPVIAHPFNQFYSYACNFSQTDISCSLAVAIPSTQMYGVSGFELIKNESNANAYWTPLPMYVIVYAIVLVRIQNKNKLTSLPKEDERKQQNLKFFIIIPNLETLTLCFN